MSETVLFSEENGVAEVILNRPDSYNAFNLEMIQTLAHGLITLAPRPSVRAVVLSGAGKAFCAGGDLKWVSGFDDGPAAGFHNLAARFHMAVLEIRRMNKPVIAAITGVAAGGGFSLALAADFRVMEENAVLRQAYTSSGLCIDGAGTHTLPRLVGLAKSLEIAAFDDPISADKALQWGLVTKVVPRGEAVDEAKQMARDLCAKSVHGFARVKSLLNDSFDQSLETQMEHERAALSDCADDPEGREGLAAFVAKRKPDFLNPVGS
jgi:2-(1,2-epoxy-1,2-dihydrophenyl)acetyl-CoA isomerase